MIHRDDDQAETIRARLSTYQQSTMPLIGFYCRLAEQGLTRYFAVDGTQDIDDIGQTIIDHLQSLKR